MHNYMTLCVCLCVCDRIGQLEESLATVTRERMRYECEFKVSTLNEVIMNK